MLTKEILNELRDNGEVSTMDLMSHEIDSVIAWYELYGDGIKCIDELDRLVLV